MRPILPNTYAFTSPYGSFSLEKVYAQYFVNHYGWKIIRESDLRRALEEIHELPEIMLMGNFIFDRAAIQSTWMVA